MASLVYPSTSGAGVGALTYSFAAVPGAEYDTTELNASSVYEFRAQEEPLTVAIYAVGNLTNPAETVSLAKGKGFTHSGTIARIRILTATSGGVSSNSGTGSTLLIIKYSSSTPTRTGSVNDGLGDVYVHTEKSPDWFAYEGYGMTSTRIPMTARLDGTANTAAWVAWTYDSTGAGVYRFRNTPSTGNGIGTSNTTFSGIAGNFFYKALNNTTNTWTRLADIPLPVVSVENGTTFSEQRLRRGFIWDQGDELYVMFRTVDSRTQTINAVQYTSSNQYFYIYTKATDTWTFVGAYNVGNTGYNSYVDGPMMAFVHTISGVKYFYNWQNERSGNGFVRYNVSTGVRETITAAADTWNEGIYVNNYFLATPSQGIGNTDGGATDYQIYDPTNNVWAKVTPPSRLNEASTWFRGGQIFRYNSTSFGVIGRRTYTTDNAAPSNGDRYYGRRLWIYDTATQSLDRWLDKSSDLDDFYPQAMRPSRDVRGAYVFQPQGSNWNGRFFRFVDNFGGSAVTRFNHDYVDVFKPKKVEAIGMYRSRGEMSVGLNSVLAFGHARNAFSRSTTYVMYTQHSQDSEVRGGRSSGDTYDSTVKQRHAFESWGAELITTSGEVYPVLHEMPIIQSIYDAQMRRYYVTGFLPSRLGYHWNDGDIANNTYQRTPWRQVSAIVEEDTGKFWYMDYNQTGDENSGAYTVGWNQQNSYTSSSESPGELAIYSNGKAFKPGIHFIRPYSDNHWETYNIWNLFSTPFGWSQRWTNYTWYSNQYTGGGIAPQGYLFGHDVLDNGYVQLVKFGTGRINAVGIPEGSIFWDGRALVQYSRETGVAPFTAAQTGWRRLHTTSSPYWSQDTTMLRTPHVWFDGRYAICEKSDGTGYYVFDMDNLAFEPKVIPSHIPNNSRPTPAYLAANSGTIGNETWRYSYNKACLGGVEIIAGGSEQDSVRTWRNPGYFIVRSKEV